MAFGLEIANRVGSNLESGFLGFIFLDLGS